MSAPGRRPWGYWNGRDMLPLEIQLADLPPLKPVRSVRVHGPRGTEDKTGQATRERIRARLLKKHGPFCHLCLLWGQTWDQARIDLTLKFPDPQCFTRDHLKPRSLKGAVHSVANQRPAHNRCNSFRGNKTMEQIKDCRPPWVRQPKEAQ